jgi:histidinol-phosphate/aromatic aminotransferase/cobyric acid decarboxylase-like protein
MTGPAPRPGILSISPYVGGGHSVEGVSDVAVLSANETPIGPSPDAVAAYSDLAKALHRYPDGDAHELRHAISQRFGCNPDNIVCGAGSDELIALLIRAYAGPGDEVLYSRHGFLMYPISAQGVGATPVAAAEANYTTDVDAMLSKVSARTRMVFIANPNNPTGSYISSDEMRRLRDGLRDDILLVIDSAYAEPAMIMLREAKWSKPATTSLCYARFQKYLVWRRYDWVGPIAHQKSRAFCIAYADRSMWAPRHRPLAWPPCAIWPTRIEAANTTTSGCPG